MNRAILKFRYILGIPGKKPSVEDFGAKGPEKYLLI